MPHVDLRAPLELGTLLRGQSFAGRSPIIPGSRAVEDSAFAARAQAGRVGSASLAAVATGSNRDVSSCESGSTFTNEGAAARQDFTLPPAIAGLGYSWIVQDTDGVRVIAATGDTIRIDTAVSATAGRIDSTTIGSTVTLQAINATEWIALSYIGTWAVT